MDTCIRTLVTPHDGRVAVGVGDTLWDLGDAGIDLRGVTLDALVDAGIDLADTTRAELAAAGVEAD